MVSAIRLAATRYERELLYSFRYRIYVTEMNRRQKYADHHARRIEDPLDATAHNLVAWDGHAVVGCVRLNFAWLGGVDYYRNLLRMSDLAPEFPNGVSLSTRLMVAPDRRGGNLAYRLSAAAYRLARQSGVYWNFLDCNDHLVTFFEKLGYVWTHRAVQEEYGGVNSMLLDLRKWSPAKRDHLKGESLSGAVKEGRAGAEPTMSNAECGDQDCGRPRWSSSEQW
jgi:GNAT superfamily N-acetyltransferase